MDIVVTEVDGERLCAIQVKSRVAKGADGGWHMRPKHEKLVADRLYYCFVDFGKTPECRPGVFVIPSFKVAEVIKRSHEVWLSIPGARGQKRKDSSVRRLVPDYSYAFKPLKNEYPLGWMEGYREAWSLLRSVPSGDPIL